MKELVKLLLTGLEPRNISKDIVNVRLLNCPPSFYADAQMNGWSPRLRARPRRPCDPSAKSSASVYRGHTPHASPGRTSATRMEENRLTALLSKMGLPQILWVVADS